MQRVLEWPELFISIVTHVELEGGVYAKPHLAQDRRASLDVLLETMTVLPFEAETLRAYSAIVETCGYVRTRVLDRMIAATALVHGLPLITANVADLRDVPGLRIEAWPSR